MPDYEHFLSQEIKVNIIIDTGDANYDFTLNSSIYPCYYADDDTDIDDKASLVWLTKQQGYSKDSLYFNDMDSSKYLQSVYKELENQSSSIASLVFLTNMSIGELIKAKESNSITLDKLTECGLFDLYGGGGSVLGIQLEKGVKIPQSIIFDMSPDGVTGYSGYSVGEVYG